MEKRIGQPVTVENHPGANNTRAPKIVIASKPDGYTLFYGTTTAQHPLFTKNNAVDAAKELAPISVTQGAPLFFFTTAKLPVSSLKELIAYSKENPGKLNFATTAPTLNLLMGILNDRTGLTYTTIYYKGTAVILPDMLSGRSHLMLSGIAGFLPSVQAGSLRVLFSTKRSSALPNVPTAADLGISDFEIASNQGIWAPLGTPEYIIQKLSAEARAVVKMPEVISEMRREGAEPVGATPEETLAIQNADILFWTKAAKLAKYEPQ